MEPSKSGAKRIRLSFRESLVKKSGGSLRAPHRPARTAGRPVGFLEKKVVAHRDGRGNQKGKPPMAGKRNGDSEV